MGALNEVDRVVRAADREHVVGRFEIVVRDAGSP
jgi:hypothetical protein